MSVEAEPFGRRVRAAGTVEALLRLEAESDKAARFRELDAVVGELIVASLRGERICETRQRRAAAELKLASLSRAQRQTLEEAFALTRQQSRGAWFVPERERLKTGRINLPFYFTVEPRFATQLAEMESASYDFSRSADTVCTWAALLPLFDALWIPLDLRGRLAGSKAREEEEKLWLRAETLLAALGLDVDAQLAPMRDGSSWSCRRADDQSATKRQLLTALAEQADPSLAARHRAMRIASLVERYYRKTKNAPPTRRQVVTKAEAPTLAAYFGGDWLAFLDYIEQEPAADEEIVTTLPPMPSAAAEVEPAADTRARIEALRALWHAVDKLHARASTRSRPPLWLLNRTQPLTDDNRFRQPQYRRLLDRRLVEELDRWWGTALLPRWPERLVTAPDALAGAVAAFGPALAFWHGCALDAWSFCEGSYARSEMGGLREAHANEIASLAELGTPVDPQLFEELAAAERTLPEPEPVYEDEETIEDDVGLGISISIAFSSHSRREGFEILRDIISRHRRAWASAHLDDYLRARWHGDTYAALREYHRQVATKGKAPPPKQLAKLLAPAANNWFGGNFHACLTACGVESPVKPVYERVLPHDATAFAQRVYERLGGEPLEALRWSEDEVVERERLARYRRSENVLRLAEESLRYLQLCEALGRPPELAEFGKRNFDWLAREIWGDSDDNWDRFAAAVEDARSHASEASRPGSAASLAASPVDEEKGGWLDRLLGR